MYQVNPEPNFNFQLNRVVHWNDGTVEDIKELGKRISRSEDWKRELITLGDKAMNSGRIATAIAYYRMSEFFMVDGDPDKKKYYNLATDMFYQYYADYFEGEKAKIGRLEVPYEGVGGTKKWERLESYGPKFVENIVQATSRDLLMNAIKTLRCCSIVAHVHDEVIIEADPRMSLDALCEQMARIPPWAKGLLLRADGYVCDFYKKSD